MKKTIFLIFPFCFVFMTAKAQINVYVEDVNNFWQAFDSVQNEPNKQKQLDIIDRLYVKKATKGLKEFINLRGGNKEKWLEMMTIEKEELLKKRPHTLSILNQKKTLDERLSYFKKLYPDFKDGDVYFTIGINNSGGTTQGNLVMIGCEVMANEKPDWAISIVLHEFVHTQQTITENALLAHSIMEGTADFVAELINQQNLRETYPNGYIDFGYKNEKEIWEQFKKVISSNEKSNFYDWLYGSNGISINGVKKKDLGYFMGYRICKSYYEKATDKKKALKEIIEYDLSSDEKAKQFLLQSGYVPKKDISFIKNLKFAPLKLKKTKIKKIIYGYKLKKNEVIFQFQPSKYIDASKINNVSIAGSFNDWKPNLEKYKMFKNPKGIYELKIPISEFDKSKSNTFKFVINESDWQDAPENAKNVENDNYGNLTLILP